MELYSNEEMADMHLVYGEASGNGRAAVRLYRQKYPNRRVPHHELFARLHRRLCEAGSFRINPHCGRDRTSRTPAVEEAVVEAIQSNPRASTRAIARDIGVRHSSVWRVLHEQSLHPFHFQRVQTLVPGDDRRRMDFVRWFLQRRVAQPDFPSCVLFTDEAIFSREGVVNAHNSHVWAHENPRATRTRAAQRRFSINVWAGIVGDCLIGPYLLPSRLDGRSYGIFLEYVLPDLLHDVPASLRDRIWFQHDGAPSHFSHYAREYLNRDFPARWIGRGGPIAWPPRSPDLSPIDFFLWGFLKGLVYETPVTSDEDLVARVVEAAARVRDRPGLFERVRQSMIRRCEACIVADGRNFEHLL